MKQLHETFSIEMVLIYEMALTYLIGACIAILSIFKTPNPLCFCNPLAKWHGVL